MVEKARRLDLGEPIGQERLGGQERPGTRKHSTPRSLIRNSKRAVILDRAVQHLDGRLQIGADSRLAQDRFERG